MTLQCSDLEIEQDVLNNNWSEKIPCNHINSYHYLHTGHFANFISGTQQIVSEVFYDKKQDVYFLLIHDCRYELTDFAYFQTSKKYFDFMQSLYPNYNPKGETE